MAFLFNWLYRFQRVAAATSRRWRQQSSGCALANFLQHQPARTAVNSGAITMTNLKVREITRELAAYAVYTRFDALPDAIQFEGVRTFLNWMGGVPASRGRSVPLPHWALNTTRRFFRTLAFA